LVILLLSPELVPLSSQLTNVEFCVSLKRYW